MRNKNTVKRAKYYTARGTLFVVVLISIGLVQVELPLTSGGQPHVLAYTTNTSRSGLLDATNAARSSSGLSQLSINEQLNNSAQQKAQHMADLNYWAHDSPDGKQPWYFFDQAGYTYIKAGENLAYGFSSSQDTINGWMNSASHKENMLGDYRDVGFGIVNTPNYQSKGAQTIVVAHYGTKTVATPQAPTAASPQPTTPTRQSSSTPQPSPQIAQPTNSSTNEPSTPATAKPDDALEPQSPEAAPAQANDTDVHPMQTSVAVSPTSESSNILGLLRNGSAPGIGLISVTLLFLCAASYATLYRRAFTHAVTSGEKFLSHHPAMDASLLLIALYIVMMTSYGSIH